MHESYWQHRYHTNIHEHLAQSPIHMLRVQPVSVSTSNSYRGIPFKSSAYSST